MMHIFCNAFSSDIRGTGFTALHCILRCDRRVLAPLPLSSLTKNRYRGTLGPLLTIHTVRVNR